MRRSSDRLIWSGLLLLSEALSFEVDAVCVVDEAIPAIDGQLDAVRTIALAGLDAAGDGATRRAQTVLKDVLIASLSTSWSLQKVSQLMRMFVALQGDKVSCCVGDRRAVSRDGHRA